MRTAARIVFLLNLAPLVLAALALGAARPLPGLGAFSAAVTVPVPSAAGEATWVGTASFTSVGSEARRSLAGSGRVAIGAPTGAFSGATAFPVTVSGRHYAWTGIVTIGAGTTSRSISGTGDFTLIGTPPPPPPPPMNPTVDSYAPANAISRATVQINGSGFDATAKASWQGLSLATTYVSAVRLMIAAPAVTQDTSGPVSVTLASGGSATGPPLTISPAVGPPPPPPPPPLHTLNVRSFGATGDGTTDDTAAMQHAVSAAVAGDTVYWPAGTYIQKDQLKLNHPQAITLLGDGPSSILKSVAGMNLYIGTGGESGGPVTVKNLFFQGTPGATMKSATIPTGGIQIFGPTGTVIDNCDFHDCVSAVYDAAPTSGTIVKNCRVLGWARIAFFTERDGQILNTKIIQTDPHPEQEATSHGIYIHGGASNVLVADCEISGVAKYSVQQYSEAPNTLTNNVRLLRLDIHDCRNGIVYAHSQQGAGDIKNSVIDSCTIRNTTGGSAILIKDGDGVVVSNNKIDNCVSYGIGVGGWAPYEQGFSLSNVDIFGNTVTNCQTGLFGLASNGGRFSNVRFHGNTVFGNRKDVDIQSVLGLSYSPGAPGRGK